MIQSPLSIEIDKQALLGEIPAKSSSPRILIIAGEASGDLHGSNLVREMRSLNPSLSFYGIGGKRMQAAGVELIAHSADMAVVGLTEVFARLSFILGVRRKLLDSLRETKPDIVILIDYPDFNMHIASHAKRYGLKIFYYISPQVWAWRKGRIYKLEKHVDRMAVILPFETQFYAPVSLNVDFVGHPLLDIVKQRYSRDEAFERFGLVKGRPVIGLLPGSRKGEVGAMLPEMLAALRLLQKKMPDIQAVLPLADTIPGGLVADMVAKQDVPVKIIADNAYDVIGICDIALVTSGTATLETALLEVPMVIVYKVSPLSYFLGRIFIQVEHIGLVNIIAGQRIVPELIQHEANAANMADRAYALLKDPEILRRIKINLEAVRHKLGRPGAAKRAAALACDLINS